MIFICWNQNFYNTKWPTKKKYLEHPFGAEYFGLNSAEMKMKTLMASPLKSKCCVEISELAMTALESEHTDLPWGEDGHFPQHRTFPRQRGEQHGNLRPFVSFQDFILSFCSPKHPLRPSQWQLLRETFGTHTFKGISFAASDYRTFFPPDTSDPTPFQANLRIRPSSHHSSTDWAR